MVTLTVANDCRAGRPAASVALPLPRRSAGAAATSRGSCSLLLLFAGIAVASEVACPRNLVLDFEGVVDNVAVGDFYAGGAGGPDKDYGITFGKAIIGRVDSDAGGTANIAQEPSGNGVASTWVTRGVENMTMTFPGGFTGMSFQYTTTSDFSFVEVYDGPDLTGNVLGTAGTPFTDICGIGGIPWCGDPNGFFGLWANVTVPFSGVAKSAHFVCGPPFCFIDDIVLTPVSPPTCPPTGQPTKPPTKSPTKPPTKPPTTPPTKPPTAPPTKSPVAACPGGATYWIYNPSTNLPIRELVNNSAACLPRRYNIEVRPCGDGGGSPPPALPVTITLLSSSLAVLRTQREYFAPFFLWGDNTSTGDVFPSKTRLRNGVYHLTSSAAVGRVRFTQACP